MAGFLFLIVLATLFKDSLQQGCQTVSISGSTRYQTSRMTTYTMTGGTHDGRPVYQSSGGDYLYYLTSEERWFVGATLGSTTVGMYVADTSMYADDTSGIWNLYDSVSDDFQPVSAVSVTGTCSTGVSIGLSTGAIVGIVVGVFFGVVILIVVLCCCCVCAASKKIGSAAANPPPPAYPGPPEPERDGTVVIIGLIVPATRNTDDTD
ncbi:uncharacterized protein [Branchiostoma lanceolatum]|uniref:uncharacterized protein n=1 Tax=Branchiostoma lanceolatum TaxID=7740 RepID=UPI003453322E